MNVMRLEMLKGLLSIAPSNTKGLLLHDVFNTTQNKLSVFITPLNALINIKGEGGFSD
jgi:hypothetical protein